MYACIRLLNQLLHASDGGLNYKDVLSGPLGDWGVLNGQLVIGEIYSVSYDPYSDSLLLGSQDNSCQLQITGQDKRQGLFMLPFSGDGGQTNFDLLDTLTNSDGVKSARGYFSAQEFAFLLSQYSTSNTGSTAEEFTAVGGLVVKVSTVKWVSLLRTTVIYSYFSYF